MSFSKSMAEARSKIARFGSRKPQLQSCDLKLKALAARINEQASQLQKVSARLQINNAPAQAIAEYP